MFYRQIHIADHKGTESTVSFASLRYRQELNYSFNNKPVQHVRLLSDSKETSFQNLSNQHKEKLFEKIVNDHVDVNIEHFGRSITETDIALMASDSTVLYSAPKLQEEIYNNQHELQKTQNPVELEANVREDTPPLRWTKNFINRDQAVIKFVFKKSLQLFHSDGLTFEFLFNMAKELHGKNQMVLLGAGEKGTEPIILQNNGTPYRGFLDGYVKDNQYKLYIRLSNQEIKTP